MADDLEEAVSETPKGKGTYELTVVMTTCMDLHKLKPNKIPVRWREGAPPSWGAFDFSWERGSQFSLMVWSRAYWPYSRVDHRPRSSRPTQHRLNHAQWEQGEREGDRIYAWRWNHLFLTMYKKVGDNWPSRMRFFDGSLCCSWAIIYDSLDWDITK